MLLTALLPLIVAASFQPVHTTQVASSSGELQLTTGTLSEPLQGPLQEAARRFALSQREALGLPPQSTLGNPKGFGNRFGAAFHLAQVVNGVEVYGAKVVVAIDRHRQVKSLASSIVPFKQATLRWALTPTEALKVASQQVPRSLLQKNGEPFGGVRPQFFAIGDELRAGYFTFVPTVDLRENWFVAVDAANGAILWKDNRVFHSEQAQVFARSPGGLDAGVGATLPVTVSLQHADGGSLIVPNDGGHLDGDQLTSYGCCPNGGCSNAADAGPKRSTGQFSLQGATINYDVVVCDRKQQASNDPMINDGGSFVYAPVDPPTLVNGKVGPVAQSMLADSDPFSEVQAFYQVNQVYDFIRGLSVAAEPLFPDAGLTGFQMRDERDYHPPRKPAVWSNVTLPDFEDMQKNFDFLTRTVSTNKLSRVDNAAFLAKENFSQLVLPEYMLDVDTLMIFQGPGADFGYDAPVLWHEFGHGVIYSTAAFDSFTLDSRSGNNEGGAMHEAIADYIAAAFGQNSHIGDYVGPRISSSSGGAQIPQDVALRNLDNALKCPEVLWGEVHQDSQHFSGALWRARQSLFQGADLGRTFDAAVYAALVSMTPKTDFGQAAALISAAVGEAFPNVPQAANEMAAVFDQRGVTHCSKVVDLTEVAAPLPYFGIGGSQAAGLASGTVVPGPFQVKIHLPEGATAVQVSSKASSPIFGAATTGLQLLARVGGPITFTRTGATGLSADAQATGNGAISGTTLTAKATLDVPCGGELYLALGTTSPAGETLSKLSFQVTRAPGCVDAGPVAVPDAGVPDAGPQPVTVNPVSDGGATASGAAAPTGCGCQAADGTLVLLAGFVALAMAGLRRRRG